MQNEENVRKGRELINEITANSDNPRAFNELLSCFSKGFPISILGELLKSQNLPIVLGALFIAEELGKKAHPILDQIIALVREKDPDVRIGVYNAISSCVSTEPDGAFVHVVLGIQDPDIRCRKIAALWMMRIPTACLQAALQRFEVMNSEMETRSALRMVLSESSRDPSQIRTWLADPMPLIRKMGVIAAGRLADPHVDLLSVATQSEDSEVREYATAQLRFLSIRRRDRDFKKG